MSHAELEAVHNNLSRDASPETVRLLATIDLLTAECAKARAMLDADGKLYGDVIVEDRFMYREARTAVTAARILPEPTT